MESTTKKNEEFPLLESSSTSKRATNVKWKQYVIGYVLVLLSCCFAPASMMASQLLRTTIPHSELNGLCGIANLLLLSPILVVRHQCDARMESNKAIWIVLGGLSMTIVTYGWYGAAYYIAIGTANSIYVSVILILNFIVNLYLVKSTHVVEVLSVIMCMAGCIFITQPKFMFKDVNGNSFLANTTVEDICHAGGMNSIIQVGLFQAKEYPVSYPKRVWDTF